MAENFLLLFARVDAEIPTKFGFFPIHTHIHISKIKSKGQNKINVWLGSIIEYPARLTINSINSFILYDNYLFVGQLFCGLFSFKLIIFMHM